MTYEFLPQEEPGKPLVTLPPGFTESVMQRIANHQRRQKRRTTAIAATALCLVAGVFVLSARRFEDTQASGISGKQAGPVRPIVKPAPAQQPTQQLSHQPAPQQTAVKRGRPAAPPAGHDQPVANVSAPVHPEEVSLTVDGKAYRCPADVLRPRNSGNVQQVRDAKPGQVAASALSRCRADPTPP